MERPPVSYPQLAEAIALTRAARRRLADDPQQAEERLDELERPA